MSDKIVTTPTEPTTKDSHPRSADVTTAVLEQVPPPTEVVAPDGSWRITVSRDLSTAFLDLGVPDTVETGAVPPHAREIIDAAVSMGVAEDVIFDEETLDRALRNTFSSRIALKRYAITKDRDASYEIHVSPDRLTATLTIIKGGGRGASLDLNALGKSIRQSGLKGMDFPKIKQDILSFYRSNETHLEEYVLCSGSAPTPGAKRELTWEVEPLPENQVVELKQRVGAEPDDTIASLEIRPVAEVKDMAMVRAESVLASITPADPGTPGYDVYGKTIPPTPGDLPPLTCLEHVRLEQEAIVAECDGILDRWTLPDGVGTALRVRPHRDASVLVNVSNDAMLASVSLTDGAGTGLRLTSELVRQALIDADVIKGIDMEAVESAVQAARNEDLEGEVVVARGQPPIEAGECRVKFHVDIASGRGVTIRADGTADYKNQDRMTTVDEGQLLAVVFSDTTDAQDGWDVRSKPIAARKTGGGQLEIAEGVRSEDTGTGVTRLYSERRGELFYDGKSLSIEDLHTIQGDVGPATGNVKFSGGVNITGSVRGGYAVMSGGIIKIAGGVDAALVTADDSIHIQHGVKGGGKAVLRARRDITLTFAESARVMAVGNVTFEKTCLQCSVKCNGKVGFGTEKGKLVGGKVLARNGVSAQQIGTKTGVPTEISFGQDYLIGDKIELEEREIEKLKNELIRLDGKIHAAVRDRDETALGEGRKQKVRALKLIDKRSERLFWLRERFEQHFDSEIEVRGTIYPGVTLESHDRVLAIDVEKNHVVFRFDSETGRITESPLDQS